jgi:hypothetical protein
MVGVGEEAREERAKSASYDVWWVGLVCSIAINGEAWEWKYIPVQGNKRARGTKTDRRSSERQEQASRRCLIYRQRAVECLVLGQAGYGTQADLIGKERR